MQGVKQVSVPIPPRARKGWSRLCWTQKSHGGENYDVWSVDSVQVHPAVPRDVQHYVQFVLNLHCGPFGINSRYVWTLSPCRYFTIINLAYVCINVSYTLLGHCFSGTFRVSSMTPRRIRDTFILFRNSILYYPFYEQLNYPL